VAPREAGSGMAGNLRRARQIGRRTLKRVAVRRDRSGGVCAELDCCPSALDSICVLRDAAGATPGATPRRRPTRPARASRGKPHGGRATRSAKLDAWSSRPRSTKMKR
jgi:hypothetical protein